MFLNIYFFFLAHEIPQKLFIIGPDPFLQYCQSAQSQPTSRFLFHKNLSSRDLSIITMEAGGKKKPENFLRSLRTAPYSNATISKTSRLELNEFAKPEPTYFDHTNCSLEYFLLDIGNA